MDLLEGQRAHVDVLVRSTDERIVPERVECLIKRPRESQWRTKALTPASWLALGHGVYSLRLDPEDLPEPGAMSVLVKGEGIEPTLSSFRVVPQHHTSPTDVMLTTLVGRVVGLDGKPKPKAQVVARLATAPLNVGGVAISNEAITVEADEDGEVMLKLVTGATVHVTIQAVNWNKQFVVPPPLAAGLPVRIFSL